MDSEKMAEQFKAKVSPEEVQLHASVKLVGNSLNSILTLLGAEPDKPQFSGAAGSGGKTSLLKKLPAKQQQSAKTNLFNSKEF